MSAGDIAGLIAAVAFVLLVGALAIPLVRLGQVLGETRRLVAGLTDQSVPLLGDVRTTVNHVNGELERVDVIATNVETMTATAKGTTSLIALTVGGPLVKVASFSYGMRRALGRHFGTEAGRKVPGAGAKTARTAGGS
jgi:hypothetical protein